MKFSDLKNKSVVILGLGKEGVSTLTYLHKLFPEKKIGVADHLSVDQLSPTAKRLLKNHRLSLHLGPNYLRACASYDVVIKTPGISPFIREFNKLLQAQKIVTSQTGLFLDNFTGRVIGVTGSKGKSTTASLICHLLQTAGISVQLGGNIGRPALELLTKKSDWAVLEMSSHQLWNLRRSPHISVFLNIYPEHLDYSDFNQYFHAKQNIARFQKPTDYFVYNSDSQPLVDFAKTIKSQKYPFEENKKFDELFPTSAFTGPANRQNLAAAVTVAKIVGLTATQIKAGCATFKPLPGRLETIGTYRGLTFVDDCLSTIPQATLNALATFEGQIGAIFLGGYERKQNYEAVVTKVIRQQIPLVILFPPTGARIKTVLEQKKYQGQIVSARSMKQAVAAVFGLAPHPSVALFSPGAPSFGMFKDYRDRSQQYRKWIKNLSR